MFTAADFELYASRFQSDPEWNARRLGVRRRLQALGEAVRTVFKADGIRLDRRESLHHPHATNGRRVRRQRTLLFREKPARAELQRFLGRELGRDLDSAVNNVHLQAGLEQRGFFFGLRLDAGAWYDLNVLLKRLEEGPGRRAVITAAQEAGGFDLEVDGGGARPVAGMDSRAWRDLAGILRPGESRLEVVRRMEAAEVAEAGDAFRQQVVDDLRRLEGLYTLARWSLDGSCPSGTGL